jgi:Ca-activated chloride channel family protein
VTPVAHDLDLTFTAAAPLAVAAVHGVPGADASAASSHIATVFLSRERGALVVRLDGAAEPSAELGTLSLSYLDVEGGAHTEAITVAAPAAVAPAFDGASTRKVLALTRFVAGARAACTSFHSGDKAAASTLGNALAEALAAEAAATGDAGLQAEADFARALATLLGATQ